MPHRDVLLFLFHLCKPDVRVPKKLNVSLSEPTQYEYPQEEQKSIQSSPPDYTIDYAALDYNQDESKMDDYDAFDYVNGDFDKVVKGSNNNKDTSKTFPPKHKGIIYSYPSLDIRVT